MNITFFNSCSCTYLAYSATKVPCKYILPSARSLFCTFLPTAMKIPCWPGDGWKFSVVDDCISSFLKSVDLLLVALCRNGCIKGWWFSIPSIGGFSAIEVACVLCIYLWSSELVIVRDIMLRNWCEWDVMVISLRPPVDRSLLHVDKCIQIRCLAIFSSLLEVFSFYRFHQMRSKPMISRMSLSLVVKIGTGHKDHNVSYFLFTSFHEK